MIPLLLALLLAGCGTPSPQADVFAPWTPDELRQLNGLRNRATLPASPTNRWADDAGAAALGRALFHDPGLSSTGTVSCATCHDPALHFTDGRKLGQGVGTTARHTPGIEGSLQGPWFYWDGRADSLWAQAAGPIEHTHEMASSRTDALRHASARYARQWSTLFGPPPDLSDRSRFPAGARPDPKRPDSPHAQAWSSMDPADRELVDSGFVRLLKAIEAYERTLLPGDAPFDHYVDAVSGGDPEGGGHLDEPAERGLKRFVRSAGCVDCHHGPMLTDRAFHNLGLPVGPGGIDMGRTVGAQQVRRDPFRCGGAHSDTDDCPELRFLNPTFEDFQMAFKTPSLRGVAATAPYMHDGSLPDLASVLAFYNELPGEPAMGHRELTLRPLGLDAEGIAEIVAFLGTLTGEVAPHGYAPETLAASE